MMCREMVPEGGRGGSRPGLRLGLWASCHEVPVGPAVRQHREYILLIGRDRGHGRQHLGRSLLPRTSQGVDPGLPLAFHLLEGGQEPRVGQARERSPRGGKLDEKVGLSRVVLAVGDAGEVSVLRKIPARE